MEDDVLHDRDSREGGRAHDEGREVQGGEILHIAQVQSQEALPERPLPPRQADDVTSAGLGNPVPPGPRRGIRRI
jgi:hypothetical protein